MKLKPKIALGAIAFLFFTWLINLIWYKPFSINLYFERLFVEYGLRHPEMLTQTHVLENYGINAHNSELNNISLEYRQETFKEVTKAFEMLRSYKRNKLSQNEQLSHDVLDFYLEKIIFKNQFFQHEIPLNHLEGIQVALPSFLIEHQKVENLQDAEHYLARIAKISDKIYQYIQNIMLKDDGDKPPTFVFEYMIDQIDCFLTADVEQNILYKDFKKKIEIAKLINPGARSELLYNLRLEIGDNVYQAFKELKIKLEVEREHTSEKSGIWRYKDGETFYYSLMSESLTVDTSLFDLERGALQEVERIKEKLAKNLSVDVGTVKEVLRELSEKNIPDRDNNKNYIRHFKEIKESLLSATPHTEGVYDIVIKKAKPFKLNYLLANYVPASLDGKRKASLLLSDYLMGFMPSYLRKGLVVSEIFPGTHFIHHQHTKSVELPNIRKLISFNAYINGWKYYVLEKANELGTAQNKLEKIGFLQWQLLYATATLVDLRIHQNNFTRKEAVDYMVNETALPLPFIVPFVDEIIVKPAKYPSYLVGFEAFKRLEKEWSIKGKKNSLQKFVQKSESFASKGAVPIEFFYLLSPDNNQHNSEVLAEGIQ